LYLDVKLKSNLFITKRFGHHWLYIIWQKIIF